MHACMHACTVSVWWLWISSRVSLFDLVCYASVAFFAVPSCFRFCYFDGSVLLIALVFFLFGNCNSTFHSSPSAIAWASAQFRRWVIGFATHCLCAIASPCRLVHCRNLLCLHSPTMPAAKRAPHWWPAFLDAGFRIGYCKFGASRGRRIFYHPSYEHGFHDADYGSDAAAPLRQFLGFVIGEYRFLLFVRFTVYSFTALCSDDYFWKWFGVPD